MAAGDNTTLPGTGDVIATDDLATLNGATVASAVKVQRMKVGFGADGDFRDVDATHGLPVGGGDFGAVADTAATSDAGSFSLIALFKRLLAKIAPLGAALPSASAPVTLPNDVSVSGGQFAAGAAVLNMELLTGTSNGWYDAGNFHSFSLQITTGAGITAGTVQFEQTNDITQSASGNAMPVCDSTQIAGTIAPATSQNLAASVSRMYLAPINSRYVRVRVSTAVAGGTVQATGIFSQLSYSNVIQVVSQGTAAALNLTANLAAGSNTIGGIIERSSSIASGSSSVKVRSTAANPPVPALLKASGGNLLQWQFTNFAAYPVYVKFYNKATAAVLASDVPSFIIAIPAGGMASMPQFAGVSFGAGLGWVITKLIADTDNTAVAADDVVGHFLWI